MRMVTTRIFNTYDTRLGAPYLGKYEHEIEVLKDLSKASEETPFR